MVDFFTEKIYLILQYFCLASRRRRLMPISDLAASQNFGFCWFWTQPLTCPTHVTNSIYRFFGKLIQEYLELTIAAVLSPNEILKPLLNKF